jgi:hypothetical protein
VHEADEPGTTRPDSAVPAQLACLPSQDAREE